MSPCPIFHRIPLTSQQIRRGLFRHQVILQTMLAYYQHIKSDIDTACQTGIHPVGILALVCAAVRTPPLTYSYQI